MTSKLGVYWSVMHRRPQDYDYFEDLQPSVLKIMDGGPNDYAHAREAVPDTLVVARSWALSEQHSDMLRDPVGTGQRHAREWNEHQGKLGFDRAKTLILGVNEPHIWEPGVPEALGEYTVAFCDEATRLHLRVGAMQLSVGWPNNTGPDTLPDWSIWDEYEIWDAIYVNGGALVCHEYWADQGPNENWGWWGGRVLKCPWQVPIVIGECGVDMFVKDVSVGQQRRGWLGHMPPERYAAELAEYTSRMSADPRFVGCCVFASDFAAHEWYSFDVEPAYKAILATPVVPAPPPFQTHLPSVGTGAKPAQPVPVPPLTHPIADPAKRVISQPFGAHDEDYARFGMEGHNGIDFAVPVGTPVQSVDTGVVMEAQTDDDGYGLYVKLKHAWGESLYAHLSSLHFDIKPGSAVPEGYEIGRSGSTGNSTGPHLHFGMRVNPYQRGYPYDGYSDPMPYLSDASPSPDQPTVPTNLVAQFKAAAAEFGLPWQLIASQAWAESSFNANAVSHTGAQGIMQIMPATWAEWSPKINAGSNPYDARQNIRAGAAYLKWLLGQTAGNAYQALIAYGWGIGNLQSGSPAPAAWVEYANKIVHGADLLSAVGPMLDGGN